MTTKAKGRIKVNKKFIWGPYKSVGKESGKLKILYMEGKALNLLTQKVMEAKEI